MTKSVSIVLFFIYTTCSWCQILTKLPVVSDLLPEHCFVQNLNYIEEDPTYGLPRCITFNNTESCTQYHNPGSIDYQDIVYKPSCSKDGQFAPKQCKGERRTGRCYCFGKDGERLFGHQWWNQADDMTCACSRKKAEMANSEYFNSLHCNAMGNFEPLQCDVLSGQCWCADEKTGALVSMVVPEKAMTKLPCYIALKVGGQYLRQCESQKYGRDKIKHLFSMHGTTLHYEELLCDEDGAWGSYSIIAGSAHCTWRDKKKIGSWQSGNNHTDVNCNCARDTVIYAEAGKSHTQKCSGNGNYEKFQKVGSVGYCVDLDGHRKSVSGINVADFTYCDDYVAYH